MRCIKAAREGLLAQNADKTQKAIISRFKATSSSSTQNRSIRNPQEATKGKSFVSYSFRFGDHSEIGGIPPW